MADNESAGSSILDYEFPWPNEEKGYAIFPKELENDPLVLFHGTQKKNLESIIKDGFKPRPPLASVSYAKNSVYSLTHVMRQREPQEDDVIIVVRFETLDTPAIRDNMQDIHVDNPELQPKIIGYCTMPHTYEHR